MTIDLRPEAIGLDGDIDHLIPLEVVVRDFLRVTGRTGRREVAGGRLKVLYVGNRPFMTRQMIREYIADRIADAAEKRKAIDARYAAKRARAADATAA